MTERGIATIRSQDANTSLFHRQMAIHMIQHLDEISDEWVAITFDRDGMPSLSNVADAFADRRDLLILSLRVSTAVLAEKGYVLPPYLIATDSNICPQCQISIPLRTILDGVCPACQVVTFARTTCAVSRPDTA